VIGRTVTRGVTQGTDIDCQGATFDRHRAAADSQCVIVDHQGVAADHQRAFTSRQVAAVYRHGATTNHQGVTVNRPGATADRLGAIADHQGVIAGRQDATDLAASRSKRLLLRYVLIVEAIDLNIWIFTPAPWWTPNVVVCDNNLEYGWSRDQENDGNTGDVQFFRYVQASLRIITLHLIFLYCS
jgi:hypothetical protein